MILNSRWRIAHIVGIRIIKRWWYTPKRWYPFDLLMWLLPKLGSWKLFVQSVSYSSHGKCILKDLLDIVSLKLCQHHHRRRIRDLRIQKVEGERCFSNWSCRIMLVWLVTVKSTNGPLREHVAIGLP